MKTHQRAGSGEQILHPTNRKLFQNWDMIRRARPAPARNDIDLRAIDTILSNLAILEAAPAARVMRFRLAGTNLRQIFNRELTGTDFLTQWTPKDRMAVEAMLRMALQDIQPLTLRYIICPASGQSETIEAIFLPLREQDQLLASFAAFSEPYWLGSHPIIKQEILSIRTVTVEQPFKCINNVKPDDVSDRNKPVVLVSTNSSAEGRALWPGFRVIPGGRE